MPRASGLRPVSRSKLAATNGPSRRRARRSTRVVDQVENALADLMARVRPCVRVANRGAAVVGVLCEDLADGSDERVALLDDVKTLGVQPALGNGRRHDRPARAHCVHDLRRVARPVERMVDPIRNQADVEGLVIAGERVLGPPAYSVHVGPRQKPGATVPPRLAGRFDSPHHHDRRAGTRQAHAIHQLPVDSIFERPDVAQVGTPQVGEVRRGGRRLGERASGQKRRRRTVRNVVDAAGGIGHRRLQFIGSQARHADRQVCRPHDLMLDRPNSFGPARPVKAVVVDIVIDRDVRLELLMQVQVMRVRHHEPAPVRRRKHVPPPAN